MNKTGAHRTAGTRPMDSHVGKGATMGFALALFALLVSGALSYYNIRRIARNEGLVVHMHEVLDEIRDTLQSLAEAEAGQRGYLITADQSYLEPQRAAVATAQALAIASRQSAHRNWGSRVATTSRACSARPRECEA
ncbi:hypothetical protein BH20VER3_BH20VER3_17240 [soil metagenome]